MPRSGYTHSIFGNIALATDSDVSILHRSLKYFNINFGWRPRQTGYTALSGGRTTVDCSVYASVQYVHILGGTTGFDG